MLDKEKIDHVANLAKLYVSDEEYEKYGKQLYDILSEIEKIKSVDISNLNDLMISPCTDINKFRNDQIGASLKKEEIFKNVKNASGDYILVVNVLDE